MHINEKNRTPKLAEEDEGPSKSELKRQMTERQKLAEVLALYDATPATRG